MNPHDTVICIDDTFPPGDEQLFSELVVKGRYYVIREVLQGSTEPYVLLVGIRGELTGGVEFGFKSRRFRKLGEAADELELCSSAALSDTI